MASLQLRGDTYSCIFMWNGKRQWLNLGAVTEQEAEAKTAKVDYLLMRLKQRLISLPPGTDIIDFVRHDGQPPERPEGATGPIERTTLALRALRSWKVRSGRLDTVRTFSGQRPALGNRTAADSRLGN